jgi:hypothetical protein
LWNFKLGDTTLGKLFAKNEQVRRRFLYLLTFKGQYEMSRLEKSRNLNIQKQIL